MQVCAKIAMLNFCSAQNKPAPKVTYCQDIYVSLLKRDVAEERIHNLIHLSETLNNLQALLLLLLSVKNELFCYLRHSRVIVEDLKGTCFFQEIISLTDSCCVCFYPHFVLARSNTAVLLLFSPSPSKLMYINFLSLCNC